MPRETKPSRLSVISATTERVLPGLVSSELLDVVPVQSEGGISCETLARENGGVWFPIVNGDRGAAYWTAKGAKVERVYLGWV